MKPRRKTPPAQGSLFDAIEVPSDVVWPPAFEPAELERKRAALVPDETWSAGKLMTCVACGTTTTFQCFVSGLLFPDHCSRCRERRMGI